MFTQEDLNTKTGPELVAIFNGLPGVTQVKRFTNRETGIKRILSMGDVKPSSISGDTDDPIPQSPVNVGQEKPAPEKRRRKRQPLGIHNLEAGPVPRSYRQNSARGSLLTILTGEGATFAQLLTYFTQWNEQQLHRTIRMTNWYLGFKLTTDENGIIRASR